MPGVDSAARHCGPDGAVRIVCHFMADQCARGFCAAAVVSDWHPAIRSDYVQVEVDQSVTADISISACDSVRSVTGRARKTSIDVDGVLRPACVLDDITQIMAFAAHRVRPIHREIRVWE